MPSQMASTFPPTAVVLFLSFLLVSSAFSVNEWMTENDETDSIEETTDLRFLYQCVDQHNEYRRKFGNEDLVNFNRQITDMARRRAEKMALTGKLSSSTSDSEKLIAENSALIMSSPNPFVDCRQVADQWFSGMKEDNTTLQMSPNRNLVWKKANQIGCARFSINESHSVVIVCNYRYSPE